MTVPANPALESPPDKARRRRGQVVVPMVIAGGLLALSLPPFGFWPLAFLGAAIVWWRFENLRARGRFLAGYVCGLVLFGVGLIWTTSFSLPGGIAVILVEPMALGFGALAATRRLGRAPALAGAMVLFEYLRNTWPFGGLPLGGIALGQAGGPLLGAARLGGPLLLVGLVWLAGAGIGAIAVATVRATSELIHRRRGAKGWSDLGAPTTKALPFEPGLPRSLRWHLARLGLVALVCAAAVVGIGAWGAVAPDGGRAISLERVAAVQGGGLRGFRKSQVDPAVVYAAQKTATELISERDAGVPPTLIIWPEDVVSLAQPLTDPASAATLSDLSRLAVQTNATLIVGVTANTDATHFLNQAVAFGPAGNIEATYEKVHRVPFGEYVPFRSFFSHLANLSAVPADAIPGHGDGVLHTSAGPIGVMLSYEVFFPDRGRDPVRDGATLLIVPTNTSSYSTSQVPTQEVAAARLQAVSEGRDLVQAAPTGMSAIIDHRGNVLLRSGLGNQAVLIADVGLRNGKTIFERYGELPVLILAGVWVLIGWIADLSAGGDPGSQAHREFRRRFEQRSREAEERGRAARRPDYSHLLGSAPAVTTQNDSHQS